MRVHKMVLAALGSCSIASDVSRGFSHQYCVPNATIDVAAVGE